MDILDLKRRRLTLIGGINEDALRTTLVAFDLLEARSRKRPIRLIFSSDGGESHACLGIYDRIKASPCEVTIECFGELYSSGTIILQAGDKRLLHPNTTFLIHYGTTSISANDTAPSVLSQVEFEKNIEQPRMEDIYLARTGSKLSRAKLREYLNKDSFFTAERAVELGLADAVIKKKKRKK